MTNRPRSVTVISWIFIALGITSLFLFLQPVDPQAPRELTTWKPRDLHEYLLSCIAPVISIVIGVCLFRGFNWARWLLVIWLGFGAVNQLVNYDARSFLRILLLGVLGFSVLHLLFKTKAAEFFDPKHHNNQTKRLTD